MHWIDPDYLLKSEGIVDCLLINPHGEIDGMLLADGMEVHVPPHLSSEVRADVQPGAAITVYGVRPRHAEMIAAVAIKAKPGKRIVDNGPPQDKHDRKKHDGSKHGADAQHTPMAAEGMVRRLLHAPKGEVRGVVLEDGRIIRIPPHEAKQCEPLLQPGICLAARGPGLTVDGTTVIDAKELGASAADLKPVRPKKPEGDGKGPKLHKAGEKQRKHA